MRTVARFVQGSIPGTWVSIWLVDPPRDEIAHAYGLGPLAEPLPPGLRVQFGEGIVGTCAARKAPVLTGDAPRWVGYITAFPDVLWELAVPVLGVSGLLGVLDLQSTAPGTRDEDRLCSTPPSRAPSSERSPTAKPRRAVEPILAEHLDAVGLGKR